MTVSRLTMTQADELRTPGEVLGQASHYLPGRGSYCWQDQIISSVSSVWTVNSKDVRSVCTWSYFRQQDVRATEVDKVDMHACFCPCDIVRAEVLPRVMLELTTSPLLKTSLELFQQQVNQVHQ